MNDPLLDALAGFYVGSRVRYMDVDGDIVAGEIRSDDQVDEQWGRLYEVRPDDPDRSTMYLTLDELEHE